MTIEQGLRLPASEDDGRQIVVQFPATEGWRTWFCGAGDDTSPTPPDSGRGKGTKMSLEFTDSGSKSLEFEFNEPVEIHDGQLFYKPVENWSIDDRFNFSINIPANSPTENGLGSGNVNLTNVGGYNIITPDANGLGTHDLTLADAIPVKASNQDGYWDVDHETGDVTPSTSPGSAKWHLIDIGVKSAFLKNMPMGHPLGLFDIDTYKAEWISPKWKVCLEVEKHTAGSGSVGSWLMCFRKNTT